MAKPSQFDANEIEGIVTRFPGPITLLASRLKWWVMIVSSGGMTALGIFLAGSVYLHPSRVIGDVRVGVGMLILCAAFFGLCTLVSVIALRRSSLRLDDDGFEVTGLFRKRYSWCEVGDFGVFSYRGAASVVFKTTTSRRSISARLNALLAGGRGEGLPDTYGLGARQLAQLMTTWQSAATNALGPFRA
jgi:hypothetical protein